MPVRSVNIPPEAFSDSNNCAVVAIAAVCGVSYTQVDEILAAVGRKRGHGTYKHQTAGALKQLGFKAQRTTICRAHGYTVKAFLETVDQSERLLIFTDRHVFALADGKVTDTAHRSRCRVLQVWRVVRQDEEYPSHPIVAGSKGLLQEQLMTALLHSELKTTSELAWKLKIPERRVRALIDSLRREGHPIVNLGRGKGFALR